MTVTLLIGAATKDHIAFEVSPIAELGAVLHLMTDPSHHAPLSEIGRYFRSQLHDDVLHELDVLSPLWTGYRCRIFFPLRLEPSASIADDLDRIENLDEARLVEVIIWGIVGGHSRAPSIQSIRASNGEREIMERARARSESAYTLARELFINPDRVRQRVTDLISRLVASLGNEWSRSQAILRADIHVRRRIVDRDGLIPALTGLTHSLRLLLDPDRVAIDKIHHGVIDCEKKTLLALPSRYGWPHLLVKQEPGWPPLIHYPLEPTATVRGNPASRVVQQRLTALSDATRLKVCRLLARERLTTTELARITNVSIPQMSRTLRQLRECSLVI